MTEKSKSTFRDIAREYITAPQESMVKVNKSAHHLSLGIPKEISLLENRTPLTPQAVGLLVANGYEITIESGAGERTKFDDFLYSEAGAKVTYDREEVYQSDILLKITFPTPEEIDLMRHGQTLISALHVPMLEQAWIKKMMDKKITAFGYEFMRDDFGQYPLVQAMSEIAGNAAVLVAAEHMSDFGHGKGLLLGGITGIPPTEVVIIGAGTVARFATRAALGLGADVKVFDSSLAKLRRLQQTFSTRVYTSIMHPHILMKALKTADVAIGAVRSRNGKAKCLVSEPMVEEMKPGAIIIDVAIDQGGCFETSRMTTHNQPVFELHGVLHYCVPNIASRFARTASYALSNVFEPMLQEIHDLSGVSNYLWEKSFARHGVYIYKGMLTGEAIGDKFNIGYRDIDLLIASNI